MLLPVLPVGALAASDGEVPEPVDPEPVLPELEPEPMLPDDDPEPVLPELEPMLPDEEPELDPVVESLLPGVVVVEGLVLVPVPLDDVLPLVVPGVVLEPPVVLGVVAVVLDEDSRVVLTSSRSLHAARVASAMAAAAPAWTIFLAVMAVSLRLRLEGLWWTSARTFGRACRTGGGRQSTCPSRNRSQRARGAPAASGTRLLRGSAGPSRQPCGGLAFLTRGYQ